MPTINPTATETHVEAQTPGAELTWQGIAAVGALPAVALLLSAVVPWAPALLLVAFALSLPAVFG